jgi:hypothetical protein
MDGRAVACFRLLIWRDTRVTLCTSRFSSPEYSHMAVLASRRRKAISMTTLRLAVFSDFVSINSSESRLCYFGEVTVRRKWIGRREILELFRAKEDVPEFAEDFSRKSWRSQEIFEAMRSTFSAWFDVKSSITNLVSWVIRDLQKEMLKNPLSIQDTQTSASTRWSRSQNSFPLNDYPALTWSIRALIDSRVIV